MINELIKISRFAGERFDLIQAGGGNSSVKDGDKMLIKSSGYHLLEITPEGGYSVVDNHIVLEILNQEFSGDKKENDAKTAQLMKNALISGERPSIETLLHSMFDKYTLHTHPLGLNIVCASKNWCEVLHKIFSKNEIICVQYKTPGIELALEIKNELDAFKILYKKNPQIVFLQNHGLIISSNNLEEIRILTDMVAYKIDEFMGFDFERYKLTNKITDLLDNGDCSYLSEDILLNDLLKARPELYDVTPFCPDKMVYCLAESLKISSLYDKMPILEFSEKHCSYPKVILYKDKIFLAGKTIRKCREAEEVLKFHLLALSQIKVENQNLLEQSELAYLGNWEAEKYRQKL